MTTIMVAAPTTITTPLAISRTPEVITERSSVVSAPSGIADRRYGAGRTRRSAGAAGGRPGVAGSQHQPFGGALQQVVAPGVDHGDRDEQADQRGDAAGGHLPGADAVAASAPDQQRSGRAYRRRRVGKSVTTASRAAGGHAGTAAGTGGRPGGGARAATRGRLGRGLGRRPVEVGRQVPDRGRRIGGCLIGGCWIGRLWFRRAEARLRCGSAVVMGTHYRGIHLCP